MVHLIIQRKSRTSIDFDEPRFHLRVNHYIKTKKLKAAFEIWYLTSQVDNCQYYDALDLDPEFFPI
jgi:hypothetical protein